MSTSRRLVLAVAAGCLLPLSLRALEIQAPLRQDLEARRDDGTPVRSAPGSPSPAGRRLAARAAQVRIREGPGALLDVGVEDSSGQRVAGMRGLPPAWLLPRLPYRVARPPDSFDAWNLMLAEYSRNGVRVSLPRPGEAWDLTVANNCLAPGLWEVIARDGQGELLHGWFDFPGTEYRRLVARTNGLPEQFVEEALRWRTGAVTARMERLRSVVRELGAVSLTRVRGASFEASGAEQQRKMKLGFVSRVAGGDAPPRADRDLADPLYFADFQAPGCYAAVPARRVDVGFLLHPGRAVLREVRPRVAGVEGTGVFLEATLELGDRLICVGNLPLGRLAAGDEIRIHGYGVGIPGTATTAADRRTSASSGTYAYLMESRAGGAVVLNSHEVGLETLDVRLVGLRESPLLEVTVGSFERVTSLARYRLALPEALAWRLRGS